MFGSVEAIVEQPRSRLADAGLADEKCAAITSPDGTAIDNALAWLDHERHHLIAQLWIQLRHRSERVECDHTCIGVVEEDGQNGLLSEPGNTKDLLRVLQKLWRQPENLSAMGSKARADFEEKYTAAVNYEILMEIYDAAIEVRQKQHPQITRINANFLK